ncbi:nucleoside-binding protein [Cohnella sp. OV330]|uniref:BMP family ABC transporter substrate-binding protein n=1 Tax=Cohnella sp. OV330 TaxID=1855288 RepID=UPI0008E99B1A|nr:BMP family ABC transporter substrate-binding protein [Cohnella sp. OV330]SFB09641.1 nucleoside-binding protein [Cohnella sp. OV330]
MKKILTLIVIVFSVFSVLTACGGKGNNNSAAGAASASAGAEASATGSPSGTAVGKKLKVAFVYATPIGETGWNYEMDRGRLALEKELGVETMAMDNVTESDAGRVFEDLAQKYDVIFGTTFGYMDAMNAAAEKHPNVKFLHATGYKTLPNLGVYAGREYQSNYLVGMAAGMVSKNGKLGYVGTFPIPEVISAINAFALGAQSVNPNAKVSVVWSNTWFDPTTEKQAAGSLLDTGVDVLAAYHDAPTILQASAERGVWGSGKDSDMSKYAPDTYLTNFVWNWTPYFVEAVRAIQEGTWQAGSYYGGMKDGVTDIAPLGKNVPQDVKDAVEAKKQEILAGTFDVFAGPIKDQAGTERAAQGKALTDEEILAMNWFVQGITSKIES